jgi:hypothetical protein
MKTAVVLAGDTRTFRECYSSLEACILSRNECDVYMHAYEDENLDEALRMYRPQKYITEKKDEISFQVPDVCYKTRFPEVDPFSLMCQWRNLQKAFDLINGNEYDCVLKTRYDIKYANPINFDSFEMGSLNVPMGGDWRGGLFDMFGFGSYEIMKNYCSLFLRFEEYCRSGVPCHSETLNRFNNRNVQINRFEYTILLRKQFERNLVEDRVFTIR